MQNIKIYNLFVSTYVKLLDSNRTLAIENTHIVYMDILISSLFFDLKVAFSVIFII